MKTITRFVIKSYLGPLLLTFSIALFILVMQFLWKYVDDLVGKGLDWFTISELLFYATATFVPMALPLAILFASLMTFGNLGERYELVALRAAGISLKRVMQPLIILSIIISIMAFLFSDRVLPVARLKMVSLLWDVKNKKPAINIKPGVFYNEIDGLVIKVGKKEKDGKTIHDILIYDYTEQDHYSGALNFTIADVGTMEFSPDQRFMFLSLYDGNNYYERLSERRHFTTRPLQRTSFETQHRRIDLSAFQFQKTNQEFFKEDFRMLNTKQLSHYIDSLQLNLKQERKEYTQSIMRIFTNIHADTLVSETNDTLFNKKQDDKKHFKVLEETYQKKKLGTAVTENAGAKESQTTTVQITGEKKPAGIIRRLLPDTSSAVAEVLPFNPKNPDTLQYNFLMNFSPDEQKKILATGLQLAKNGKRSVNDRYNILDSRMRLIRKYEIERQRMFTLSVACLILFFIGAPLGAIIRKGGLGMPAVVSTFFFIIFHVLSITGDKLAREGTVSPIWGMWMASVIILPIGILLTAKATTDSVLLDIELYKKFFSRLVSRKSKIDKDEDITVSP